MQNSVLNVLKVTFLSFVFISCNESMTELEFGQEANTVETISEISTELRPSDAIIVKNSCVCSMGQPVSIGDCQNTCRERTSVDSYGVNLYFDVDLTAEITETKLEDLAGFCNTQEGEAQVASCHIEVKGESGEIHQLLSFEPMVGQNKFNVAVNSLRHDETFRMAIVEAISGARSSTFQVRISSDTPTIVKPLALVPINQYLCNINENYSFRTLHMYFNSETRPEALDQRTNDSIICHDLDLYGEKPINNPLLAEESAVFSLWSKNDPRFYDLDNDGVLEVHNFIEDHMDRDENSIATESINIFKEFSWISGFSSSGELESIHSGLGFYMMPFIDSETYLSYCPTQEHYYSTNPLMKALKEIVGVDTEAIYILREEGGCDTILVRESVLKKSWFYLKNGKYLVPDGNSFISQQVKLHWPINENSSPYIKAVNQKTYILEDLNNSAPLKCAANSLVAGLNFPTHDKRVGCIPK